MSTPAPTDNTTPRLALSLNETADLLGVSRRTLWTWASSGLIPAFKAGPRLWLFPRRELEAWLAERANEHAAAVR